MNTHDSLPIPKWLVKGKKLKLPNGNVVTFGGVDEYNNHDEITLFILKECRDRGFLI